MRAVDRIKQELDDQGKKRDWRKDLSVIRRRRYENLVELERLDVIEACSESPKQDRKLDELRQGSESALGTRVNIRVDDAYHIVDSYPELTASG